MTGSTRYLVRYGFTQCSEWRDALGNDAQLLAFANIGECLDAPEWIPNGCSAIDVVHTVYSRT